MTVWVTVFRQLQEQSWNTGNGGALMAMMNSGDNEVLCMGVEGG